MKVVIMHQKITNYDIIGADISNMYDILNKNHICYVYCDSLFNDSLQLIDRKKLHESIISDKNNLIIYHHSEFWEEGERILENAKAKIIFKCHNIVPEGFYNKHKNALWIGDSLYNLQDIESIHSSNKIVIPPFNHIEKWEKMVPEKNTLKKLIKSDNVNLLFIGRVVPSKGYKFLFSIVRDYIDNYGHNIRLNIIGKRDDVCKEYNKELASLIKHLDLKKYINFIEEVNDNIILSYYLGSDYFVCCSDYEGFCVPIVEAQICYLPVIAKETSAVKETLGDNQIILKDDVKEYSTAIKVLTDNIEYKNFIINDGLRNYMERFSNYIIAKKFKNAVETFTGEKI